ncbi:lipocalin-like domain-containing protein [Thalassomonas actiniarum]|uniref:Carotenoid 1,2-hydratase n=1 Tax=Thalassomonas actiniarum TaxID=485447 RepID=A0AAE9YRN3_9GAMM|nr:lipocalin-like domain-containing protein [Thalassomonas actiniarum]WDD99980.1 carotenoid 1,2-hydratase [Thalassomonas actiniarum]
MNSRTMISQLLFALVLLQTAACGRRELQANDPLQYLNRHSEAYQGVTRDHKVHLPRDHWPHPLFQHEWWYLNALLTTNDGQQLSAQWTLFRTAHKKRHWYFAHAALANKQEHRASFRQGRREFNNVTISHYPFKAAIDDWSWQSSGELLPATLTFGNQGEEAWQAILNLSSANPFFLQGEQGYNPRHNQEDIASYYYSHPFIQVTGKIWWQGRWQQVNGDAWFDREWGSKMLSDDQLGWDWFSLRLTHDSRLMVYRLRSHTKDFISGSLMSRNGEIKTLDAAEIRLSSEKPRQQAYPDAFTLSIPTQGIDIRIEAINKQQILSFGIEYFEGMVSFHGSHQGQGFLEMTGYRQ